MANRRKQNMNVQPRLDAEIVFESEQPENIPRDLFTDKASEIFSQPDCYAMQKMVDRDWYHLSDRVLQNKIENVRTQCSLALEGGVDGDVFAKEVEQLLELLRSGGGDRSRRKRPRRDQGSLEEVRSMTVSEEGHLKTSNWGIGTALTNELILKNIFRYLTVDDLKDCKAVNQVWNRMSNESLSGRNTFLASHLFGGCWGPFSEGNGRDPGKELASCLEINRKETHSWPAPGIILDSQGFHADPRASGLLESFGKSIKRLRVTNLRYLMSSLTWNLLEKGLPNLVSLQLIGSEFLDIGLNCPMFPEGGVLPALKTLRMPSMPEKTSGLYDVSGRVVRAILSAAINLKLVENFSPGFTEDLARLNKLGTVRSLALKLTGADSSGAFLDTLFPCLKRVRITTGSEDYHGYGDYDDLSSENESESEGDEVDWERIDDALDLYKDVFSRWVDTVEELEIPPLYQVHKNLPGRMPNLRRLTISGNFSAHRFLIFFGDKESEHVFPALEEICLEMGFYAPPHRGKSPYAALEERLTEASFPQVKTLRIKGRYWDFHTLTTLDSSFPNLTSLQVHWKKQDYYGPSDYYALIWRLDFLTRLEIIDFSLAKFIAAESFLTGLDNETCQKLQKESKLRPDLIFFRKRNSISELHRLRQFKLVLSDVPNSEDKEIGILSHVSHFYGFGCVPNLQVVICYNFRHAGAPRIAKAIEGIRPFVTVVHEELK